MHVLKPEYSRLRVTSLVRNAAYVAAVSFPFPGGDRTNERKSGRAKEHTWGEQITWKKWGGGGREGGEGEREPPPSASAPFFRTPSQFRYL